MQVWCDDGSRKRDEREGRGLYFLDGVREDSRGHFRAWGCNTDGVAESKKIAFVGG